ncbi:Hydantoinase B/oxoprolinase-domain-containing protein [Rhodofomes roseus]|uniref:Hydantoinase B/oxoprolinase-domain-containing protein n=1 Tax=Rhodofomes roseus TaxID=34475 RepID=A0ABQ8JZY4_9APHY|nr:Hydantoinase B/oxoprolinase-domain-containing protein [Rhodofomes roseus]KAH9829407.1 Hydantoinase B/oxoprolinase-domain-containing protein [Rhodofomes roseus]
MASSTASQSQPNYKAADSILLTLFANRFMSVAEAMGRSLQQAAISTSIKERLDFLCALFAPDGDLVANAPFIPIHLGPLSLAVRYQMKLHGKSLKPGDVLMTNSPWAGGSHLPDITTISPAFDTKAHEISFFTAWRAHHADIGGILPGSMPRRRRTFSRRARRSRASRSWMAACAMYPGSSGCRNIKDVESDLKAATNHRGIQLIQAIVDDCGLKATQEYMHHIWSNAEQSARNLFRDTAKRAGTNILEAIDYLDGGSPVRPHPPLRSRILAAPSQIRLKVPVNEAAGSAMCDFTGTGCERAMLNMDIPLNAGCLVPGTATIPEGSLLSERAHEPARSRRCAEVAPAEPAQPVSGSPWEIHHRPSEQARDSQLDSRKLSRLASILRFRLSLDVSNTAIIMWASSRLQGHLPAQPLVPRWRATSSLRAGREVAQYLGAPRNRLAPAVHLLIQPKWAKTAAPGSAPNAMMLGAYKAAQSPPGSPDPWPISTPTETRKTRETHGRPAQFTT